MDLLWYFNELHLVASKHALIQDKIERMSCRFQFFEDSVRNVFKTSRTSKIELFAKVDVGLGSEYASISYIKTQLI